MKKLSLNAAIASLLLASGTVCAEQPAAPGTAPKPATSAAAPGTAPAQADPIALVNGKPISKAALDSMTSELAMRRGGGNIPGEKLVEQMIQREVLRQEAESQNLAKDPKYSARMENAQRMALSQIAVEHFMATVTVSEEEIKKEYDQRTGAMKSTEYKARHILLDSEKAAKDVIAKLKKGQKFDALAKKLSKDPGSKANGGDLGWFNPQQMVPPFSQAVIALKNGEMTETPVQSQFGWHVILREDARDQPPPPFDAVKDQFKSMLQSQKLQAHIAELMAKAKVENHYQPPAPPAPPTMEAGQPKPAAPAPQSAKPAAPAPQPAAK